MTTPRMIAVDIDGTLTAAGGVIRPRTLAALRGAAEAGTEIVIATGRRFSFALPMLGPLEMAADAVLITANGSVVRTLGGELIERTLLEPETAREICRQLPEYTDSMVFTFDVEGRGSLVIESLETLSRSLDRWVIANQPEIETVNPLIDAFTEGSCPMKM